MALFMSRIEAAAAQMVSRARILFFDMLTFAPPSAGHRSAGPQPDRPRHLVVASNQYRTGEHGQFGCWCGWCSRRVGHCLHRQAAANVGATYDYVCECGLYSDISITFAPRWDAEQPVDVSAV